MLRQTWTRAAAVAALLALPILSACDDQQTAEKAGQEIGRAIDQTAERVGEATKDIGAKAGQMMQDAGSAIERKAQDAKQ
ncbi:hypothetical protein [Azospirillum soli]|uniref:hypothetical protein n=1 Tax=Azospirillum soli TaxID=1304799 RepID=UPI001AE18FE4|nr:hypothetical protein [Azospirillum soli]MBP2312066.1 hypothetical protein [Azospirillum soli]